MNRFSVARRLVAGLCLISWATAWAGADDSSLSPTTAEEPPPSELSEGIREVLQSRVVQLGGEKPTWEFWWVSKLPLKSKPDEPGDAVKAIRETTFMGAVRLNQAERDYRDEKIEPGVYTIRFGLQPVDGDHLGTSTYPYFAVLTPEERDDAVDALNTYNSLMEASGEGRPSEHPIVLSLFPVSSEDGKIPRMTEPESSHRAVRVQIPAGVEGEEEASAVIDFVVKGTGHL